MRAPWNGKKNTQLRKDQQTRKLQTKGGGGSRRPPFVVAAQRAAPVLLWSFLKLCFFSFSGGFHVLLFFACFPFHFIPLRVFHFLFFWVCFPPMYFVWGLSLCFLLVSPHGFCRGAFILFFWRAFIQQFPFWW